MGVGLYPLLIFSSPMGCRLYETYTVTVTNGKKEGSASDIQAVVKTIPLPDVKYFSPLINSFFAL